jgi:hypothetical protein
MNCCGNLFSDFTFNDLVTVEPPKDKGIYVIKIREKNNVTPESMIKETEQLVSKMGWTQVKEYIMGRVERLREIDECPVIYIGSAGTREESKNTLKGRYEEFSGRHTVMYPIWVLLYFGWKLDYGWKIIQKPREEECRLKKEYKKRHSGKLPALVIR